MPFLRMIPAMAQSNHNSKQRATHLTDMPQPASEPPEKEKKKYPNPQYLGPRCEEAQISREKLRTAEPLSLRLTNGIAYEVFQHGGSDFPPVRGRGGAGGARSRVPCGNSSLFQVMYLCGFNEEDLCSLTSQNRVRMQLTRFGKKKASSQSKDALFLSYMDNYEKRHGQRPALGSPRRAPRGSRSVSSGSASSSSSSSSASLVVNRDSSASPNGSSVENVQPEEGEGAGVGVDQPAGAEGACGSSASASPPLPLPPGSPVEERCGDREPLNPAELEGCPPSNRPRKRKCMDTSCSSAEKRIKVDFGALSNASLKKYRKKFGMSQRSNSRPQMLQAVEKHFPKIDVSDPKSILSLFIGKVNHAAQPQEDDAD